MKIWDDNQEWSEIEVTPDEEPFVEEDGRDNFSDDESVNEPSTDEKDFGFRDRKKIRNPITNDYLLGDDYGSSEAESSESEDENFISGERDDDSDEKNLMCPSPYYINKYIILSRGYKT